MNKSPKKREGSGALRTYRKSYQEAMALTGPVLPLVSFLGRLPLAMCQLGTLLLVAETSGSLTTAGLVGGALAAGQTVGGPLLGRAADRRGQRVVVLSATLLNAVAVTALVLASLARPDTLTLALIAVVAGASVPQIGPMSRTRTLALARREDADERLIGTVLSFEGTLDEVTFVLGPALVGLAVAVAHPAAALLAAAGLLAVCGTWFALHPTASLLRPAARTPSGERTRLPGSVYALRLAMALQGAMFGASQAGITALTEDLGTPEQAGLVYAAMGVMSAVAGFSMAAVPASVALSTRWRIATAALVVLSVPLLFVSQLWPLYVAVVVLGVALAPNMITIFGLTERVVPATRLAESMAYLMSGIVGGQALALALSGRLAESSGPPAAFAVVLGAAVLCAALSWAVRPRTGRVRTAARGAVTRGAEAPSGSGRSA
ncbi:MFS transporter [Streptomyces sp. NBC_00237]|uniref:MFS transporter n=1 Tax=Streptomyces sp. NBC_00237 TaxID=2975687 RepID=UPI00225B1EB5|nr:MFS transporter [Streptomyces sp. NBC_00237]MCX5203437.1 MFS transporter [Streptomyces sp. NBC_00237]